MRLRHGEPDGLDRSRPSVPFQHALDAINLSYCVNFAAAIANEVLLRAGAIGYLLKNVGALALGEAIRAARLGRPTLGPEATRALISRRKEPPARAAKLTARELDVLWLMV